jgi:hypothetical protein
LPIQCAHKDGTALDLLICSEISKDPEDGLVITVLRQVGAGSMHIPAAFASTDWADDPFEEEGLISD